MDNKNIYDPNQDPIIRGVVEILKILLYSGLSFLGGRQSGADSAAAQNQFNLQALRSDNNHINNRINGFNTGKKYQTALFGTVAGGLLALILRGNSQRNDMRNKMESANTTMNELASRVESNQQANQASTSNLQGQLTAQNEHYQALANQVANNQNTNSRLDSKLQQQEQQTNDLANKVDQQTQQATELTTRLNQQSEQTSELKNQINSGGGNANIHQHYSPLPIGQSQGIDVSHFLDISNRLNRFGNKLRDIEIHLGQHSGYKRSGSSSSSASGDYNYRKGARNSTPLDGYAQSLPSLAPNIGPKPSLNATGYTDVSTGPMADHLRNINLSEDEQKKAAIYGDGPPDEHETVKKTNYQPPKPDDDNPGGGVPPVNVHYFFLDYTFNSNSINYTFNNNSINYNNYNNVNTLIKVNKLFNSSFNLSTKHLYANKLAFKLNSLNNISNIKNINYYNLNNNLNNDNLINNDLNNNTLINHSKLSNNKLINNLDSCKEVNNSITENKLLNIISNSSSSTFSTGNTNYSIGQKLNSTNTGLIKPSKITYNNSLKNNNFNNNNNIEIKEQINSFPIDEKNCSKSLLEDELIIVRTQKNDEWVNYKTNQNGLVNNQQELVFISNENNNLNSLIKKPLTKSILKCNNNDNLINLEINKSNDLLQFNSIEITFISHSLYLEFLDLLICQLFFINKIINLNLGCFIYGSVIIPTIFTLNIFGCLLTVFIFSIIFNLFNQIILFILKNCLNKKNYNLVNSKLSLFYNICFNSLFLYIFYINILNINILSNLILLKSILLFNENLLADLNYLNHKSIEVYDITLNNNKILNTFIYKSKRDL